MCIQQLANDGFMPYKINWQKTSDLISEDLPDSVSSHAEKLVMSGWRFYVVDSKRGKCSTRHKVITVPAWAYRKGQGYVIYYLAHEMAHAYDENKNNHKDAFMRWFKAICPIEFWHHELGYKPQAAKRNGIVAVTI